MCLRNVSAHPTKKHPKRLNRQTPAVPFPQAGDSAKVDPRCIVSRGAGLAVRPPDALGQGGLIKELKRRLLKVQGEDPHRDPLRTIANTMASNTTDCLLAPHFPGDIALVSLSSDEPPTPSPVGRRARNQSGRRGASGGSRGRPQRGSSAARREGRPSPSTEHTEARKLKKLVMVTQALVAVGADVTVTPLASGVGAPKGSAAREVRSSPMGHLSICEGPGAIAVAAFGRLRTVRLKAGQRRLVDSSRVVGWTSGVTCLAGQGRTSGKPGGGGGVPPVTSFVGPGDVYVQTHSLSGLRRLLLPQAAASLQQGGGSGFRRFGQAGGRRGGSRRAEVGLSLKRGLAKRAREGARRAALALAFFGVYVVVYSLVTALLLEGRDGIPNAPRHAVQVVRSLSKVMRRLAVVMLKLGREELWGAEGGGARGVASISAEAPAER